MHLWRPSSADPGRLPGELVGSSLLRPGQLRVWPAGRSIITAQAQILKDVPVSFYTRYASYTIFSKAVQNVVLYYDQRFLLDQMWLSNKKR